MTGNRIVTENERTDGVAERSYWDAQHSAEIEGFATEISVNAGGTVDFKINVNDQGGSDYKVEIFRLGYYGGNGAREVARWTNTDAVDQAAPLFDESRGLVDAGNWLVTDSWDIPADAVSGVYLARIQRLDAGGNPIAGATNQIPFIVRNDGVPADIVLQTSDTTWQAYNGWAGELGNANQVGPNFYGDPAGIVDHEALPGGGSFAQDRAYAVSYNRPFITRDAGGAAAGAQDYLFGADYAAINWLEQNGYDVTYISGVDTDRMGTSWYANESGEVIRKSYISVGHDEYWSGDQRINVESARDAGVNLMFWGGNDVYWKTRWETSISADGTEFRTLVCYKETWANGDPNAGPDDYNNIDPSNVWTGTWRDTRFWDAVEKDAAGNVVLDGNGQPIYIAGGKYYLEGGGAAAHVDSLTGMRATCNCAENSLTGTLFGPDGNGQSASIDVPSEYGNLRVWRNTTIAEVGDDMNLAHGIIGYEWNTVPEDELRPAGLIKLSSTTRSWNNIVVDDGNSAPPGVATHTLSLYRAESGALVFGAGTVFWSWGLSDEHDSSPYGGNIEDAAFKQFTINMFADMGIQPGVADSILAEQGLLRATASTDVTAATVSLNAIPEEVHALSTVILSGTATDDDGNAETSDGTVALVEVSLDNGATWHVAQGTANWTYAWRPLAQGDYHIKVRAIDDSLNVYNTTAAEVTVTVAAPIPPDTYSLFEGGTPTGVVMYNDSQASEVGMKFNVDRTGSITELKYYRAVADADDTDVRIGHLWRFGDGALLATVTFTSGVGESGWQVAQLSAPVALLAGVDYIVSYRTEDNYVASNGFFDPANEVSFDGVDDDAFSGYLGVISAPQNSVIGLAGTNGNGIYRYGPIGTMPDQTFGSSNYWVDVTFDDTDGPNTPPVITSQASFSLVENQVSVGTITATDAENAVIFGIAGGADAARFAINSTTGALSFVAAPNFEAPTDAGGDNVYDLIVSASDGVAPAVTQAVTVTVTDVFEPPSAGSSIFEGETPTGFFRAQGGGGSDFDPSDYELGTKFTVNQTGYITKLQYFRGAIDAGDAETRTLNLWNAAGVKIGTVAVASGVGDTGWQVGTLAAPIAVLAGTTYIVSYGYDQDGEHDAYAGHPDFFASSSNSSPDGALTALQSGVPIGPGGGGAGNGLYSTTVGSLPQQSYNSSNYWVDVVFVAEAETPNTPPEITSPTSFTIAENLTAVGSIVASDAENAVTYGIAGGADAAKFTINASTGALGFVAAPDFEAPTDDAADNVYDLVVSASDGIAPAVTQAVTVTVTDQAETTMAEARLYAAGETPASAGTDATDYELGTKFSSSKAGFITALQYYRIAGDAGDTDIRTLNLWTMGGTNLGSAQVTSTVGATGWQVATLSAPIAISAGTTYIVSYSYDQDGVSDNYAYTADYFSAAHAGSDGILTALAAGGASGPNGVFAMGSGNFPTGGGNANYWTDVIVQYDPGTPNTAPYFTSPATFAADENQVLIGAATAGDNEGGVLSYGIAGGLDGALFSINAQTGALRFKTPQDFETDASYQLTLTVSDGTATTSQLVTVNLNDVDETAAGPAAMTGAALTANYVFGSDMATLYSGAGASQTATVGAGVEFAGLPEAGPEVGNGPYGLASVDVGTQTIRIDFPLDAGFGAFLPFATIANQPFNGVQLLDTTNNLPTILSARIIGQEGFTDQAGNLVNLTAADLTVTADGIFLNVAGKGRTTDVDTDAAGLQHSYVTLLVDLNDAPEITANGGALQAALEVAENATLVSLLAATDADTGQAISYGLSGEDAALFQIVGSELRFVDAPDAETPPAEGATPGYQVTVTATDGFGGSDSQDITVSITDVDEVDVSTPVDLDSAANAVTENAAIGTAIGLTASASDGDATNNQISYSLVNDAGGRFAIDASTGVVTVAGAIDRELLGPSLDITVLATSEDGSTSSSTYTIAIADMDEFDVTVPADIDTAANQIVETATAGTLVGITAHAGDADATTNAITYSLTGDAGGRFVIGASSGIVSVADGAVFDRGTDGPTLGITVRATSADGSVQDAGFVVALDAAPNSPVSLPTDINAAANSVNENAAIGTAVGLTAHATDPDTTNNAVTYSLSDSAGGLFAIDSATGVVTVAGAIDREVTGPSLGVTVLATSQDGTTASSNFSISIVDVDEANARAPVDTNAAANAVLENAAAGTLVGLTAYSVDSDATNSAITYSLTNNAGGRFVIDATTGVVSVAAGAVLDYETQTSFKIKVKALSADGSSAAKEFNIAILNVNEDGTESQTLTGTAAANVLEGAGGNDVINGNAGNDTLSGLGGADLVNGGAGNDLIYGGAGNDTLTGGVGTDSLFGGDDDDLLQIRSADDTSDLLFGGAGTDTLRIIASGGIVTLAGLATTDIEIFDGSGHFVTGTTGNNTLDFSGFTTVIGLAGIRGNKGNDAIIGSAFGDTIEGGVGIDSIYGGGGDDLLLIRAADDTNDLLFGGEGTDTLRIIASGGSVTLAGLATTDIEVFDGSGNVVMGTTGDNILDFSRFASVVGLAGIQGGKGNDVITGSAMGDSIDGGEGKDTISGGAGSDTLVGGNGNDLLTGGGDADIFVFNFKPVAGKNVDTIADFVSGTDRLVFDDAIFTALTSVGGALQPDQFILAATAADAGDRLLYDAGKLYYDQDGTGSSGKVLVANLTGNPALSASDILII